MVPDVKNSLAEIETINNNSTQPKETIRNEPINEEVEQILVFHEEGVVSRDQDQEQVSSSFKQLKDLDDVLANDVIGFLKRPVHYADFVWKASEVEAIELIPKIQLPAAWISKNMIYEKLQGFRYLKCDFKIRVQVNAQPFNAGLLLLNFIPIEDQMTTTPSSLADFGGLTGYPNVTLDLGRDTSCELMVPFTSIISHFDLVRGYGYLGAVKLFVYSPLTGLDDVDGTVWITAENVEVSLPTGLPVVKVTESGQAQGIVPAPKTSKDMKMTTRKPDKEGVLSGVASKVAETAGALKQVPVLGSVASSVEWAASAVSNVANFFGFSKPTDPEMPCRQTIVTANNFANYDGDSKAKSLAFSWTNETEIPTATFASVEDEMSFSHILSKRTYMQRFRMEKNQAQGSIIFKWPVDPTACRKSLRNDPKVAPYMPNRYICLNTFVSYICQFFKYWRGTLNYHVRIIKTCFHSGRIRVFVVPGATPLTDVTTIDFNKVHSTVYDVRDTNEFDIVVPYKWNVPWKSMDGTFIGSDINQAITANLPTAMIYVQVVNALRNPTTAADHIEFIVEESAGDDFQVAVPLVNLGDGLVTSLEALKVDFPVEPSLYGYDEVDSGRAQGVEMLDDAGGEQIVANKIAIGERYTGFRTLLKRYARYLSPYQFGTKYILNPYSEISETTTRTPFDFYGIASLLYRYKSGSLRLAAKTLAKAGNCEIVVHEVEPYESVDAQSDPSGAVLQSETLEPLVELAVPFYQPSAGLLTSVGNPRGSQTEKIGTFETMPYNLGTIIRSTKLLEWWRSTGEDFSFGFLIGPPQTYVPFNVHSRSCKINWMNFLIALSNGDYWLGTQSEELWANKTVDIYSDTNDNYGGQDQELRNIYDEFFNEDTKKRYIAMLPTPDDARDYAIGLTREYASKIDPYFRLNCAGM